LGWYNIDVQVEGYPGTALCDLFVQVWPTTVRQMNVYVFFPRYKDLSVGQLQENNVFHFDKVDGKIPLLLGAKGFIVAFGSVDDQLYFGTARFTAQPQQQIKVNVQPGTEDEFLNSIKEGKLEGIRLDLIKQKMKVEYRPCDGSDTANYSSENGVVKKKLLLINNMPT
jgi:hypothetical protein